MKFEVDPLGFFNGGIALLAAAAFPGLIARRVEKLRRQSSEFCAVLDVALRHFELAIAPCLAAGATAVPVSTLQEMKDNINAASQAMTRLHELYKGLTGLDLKDSEYFVCINTHLRAAWSIVSEDFSRPKVFEPESKSTVISLRAKIAVAISTLKVESFL